MGEWEQGLKTARELEIIDESTHDRLVNMSFNREVASSRFPMRIALIVLGAILLVSAGFAIFVRVLGDEPSQVLAAAVLAVVAAVAETVARFVHRVKPLKFLAAIIGCFVGIPLGLSLAVLLPDDPKAFGGVLGTLIAAVWSWMWFRRTKSGLAIAAVVLELAGFVVFVSEWWNFTYESAGVVLSVVGALTAVASIVGRIKPSLPPLVASLIVIGWGCGLQGPRGVDVIAVIGIAISAGLFLLSYRRSEALMSAATAISTGVWAVVLTGALTEGSLAPLIVAAVLGLAMVLWGARRSTK